MTTARYYDNQAAKLVYSQSGISIGIDVSTQGHSQHSGSFILCPLIKNLFNVEKIAKSLDKAFKTVYNNIAR